MSLVAYGSSDESEESDSEEQTAPQITNSKQPDAPERATFPVTSTETRPELTEPHISDDDDENYVPVNILSSTQGLSLPPPKYSSEDNIRRPRPSSGVGVKKTEEKLSLLGLPAPVTSSKDSVLPPAEKEDELEEMVKPKEAEMASREKPPPKRKTIKITVPSLEDYGSDEDEPASKKPKPSTTGSGLFALLPKPKYVSVKEAGRLLIPHTLTKKPAAKKTPSIAKPAPKPSSTALPQYNSDEEEEESGTSSNFFSIGSEEEATKEKALLSATSYSVTSNLSTSPPVPKNTPKPVETDSSAVDSTEQFPMQSHAAGPSMQDAPLQFKSSVSSSLGYGHSISAASDYGTVSKEMYPKSRNEQYNMAAYDNEQPEDMPYPDPESEQQIMPKEELLRLQGKKQWGREAINIIDVSADDQTCKMDLTKNLTEEVDMHSHSKKNKDLPSGQQRRKHQITYLAHMAKEREFDLKNQWSQNRQNKKQTQNKYGF